MTIEDRIAIVLEELGLYAPENCASRQALKRAKKRIAKILKGEEARASREGRFEQERGL